MAGQQELGGASGKSTNAVCVRAVTVSPMHPTLAACHVYSCVQQGTVSPWPVIAAGGIAAPHALQRWKRGVKVVSCAAAC